MTLWDKVIELAMQIKEVLEKTEYRPPVPTPDPKPEPPKPDPIPAPPSMLFLLSGNVISLDMTDIPDAMRKQGFQGRDNALYYSLSHVMAFGPGLAWNTKGDSELENLLGYRERIFQWFNGEIEKVRYVLKTQPATTLIAVTNDAVDRLGVRLGPAICKALEEFGDRVQLGEVTPWEDYD